MGLFRKNGLARFLKNSIFVQGEAFDARLEFKKIVLLPKKERQKTLDEFRKKYFRQKIGIALLQVRVLDLIRRDPDLSTEELCSDAKELGFISCFIWPRSYWSSESFLRANHFAFSL